MATDSPAAMSNETSLTMVSIPSGLVTFFVRLSAFEYAHQTRLVAVNSVLCAASRWRPQSLRPAPPSRARRQSQRRVWHQGSGGLGQPACAATRPEGYGYKVVNASVTGETTRWTRPAAACAGVTQARDRDNRTRRQRWPARPAARRQPRTCSDRSPCAEGGARVLLVGMMIPPNYGPVIHRNSAGCSARWRRRTPVPHRALPAGGGRPESCAHAERRHPREAAGSAPDAREPLADLKPLRPELLLRANPRL